jgi:hypothetical protein
VCRACAIVQNVGNMTDASIFDGSDNIPRQILSVDEINNL